MYQRPKAGQYELSEYWLDTMLQSKFIELGVQIAIFMGWAKKTTYLISTPNGKMLSTIALKMQIFIAFAYTYHYLNWFSKTKIINWHQVSKNRLLVTFTIWIASMALYVYDYKLGLSALFFLSVLHVFLEFPLNHLTFVGIYKELKTRITSKK